MPKPPRERRPSRPGRPASSPGSRTSGPVEPLAGADAGQVPAHTATSRSFLPGWAARSLNSYATSDPPDRREADLQNLTRSPLLPQPLRFMSPTLVLRGIALTALLFSYLGSLALAQSRLGLWDTFFYTLATAVIASCFVYTTNETRQVSLVISLGAILLEAVATVAGLLIMGFSNPFYFTIIPFYIVAGHIQGSFTTRPALAVTFALWLSLLTLLLVNPDPLIRSGFWVVLLMLTLPFLIVTLVVRFVVREGRQRAYLVGALESLRISEERYRQVTDRANDAIYILDAAGHLSFINPKTVELTGYREEELIGQHFSYILTPENQQAIRAVFRDPTKLSKAEREKMAPANQTFLALEIARPDGSSVMAEVTAAAITDAQGRHSGWVGVARDVTERIRMRQQVERSNRDLTALNTVISSAGQSLELDKLLNDAVTTLVEVLKADVAGITLIEEGTRLLKVGAYKGLSDTVVRAVINASIENSEGFTREVATTGKPLLINDMSGDPRLRQAGSGVQSLGLRSFAAAPLKSRDRLLGVVSLISHQVGVFQPDDLALLASIGSSLAVAIENARLYGTSLNQVREMTCLAEIARAINLSESLGQTLTNIAESISLSLGYKACAISLINPAQLQIQAYGTFGMPNGFLDRLNLLSQEGRVPREELLKLPLFHTLEAAGPVVYQVRVISGLLGPITQEAVNQGWNISLTVPFHIQGRPAGVISCYAVETTPPPASELRLLETIANQTSLAVQNAYLYREQGRRADQLRAVSEIGRQIGAILNVDELLPYVARLLQQTFDYYLVNIMLVDSDDPDILVTRASHSWSAGMVDMSRRFRISQYQEKGLVAWVARHGQPLVIGDVAAEPRFLDYAEKGIVRSEMVVPIKRGGVVIGVIDLASTLLNGFGETDLATMQALTEQVSIALENARLYTEVNRVVVQLTNANVELEEATRHKSEFLANMSHELRTPLNAIIGFSEVLQDQVFGSLNERQQRYVHNILTSGRHLLNLVNDVLDLAKVEAGRMELRPEEFNPEDAVKDVENILSVSAGKKTLSIQNTFQADLPLLRADKSKYKQVLYNLLSNAVKFTPEGGHITVGNYRHHENDLDYLAVWVKDTGIGIRHEDQLRIFEEFRQVDSSYARQHQGTGLGLALSKRLIELHSGRIWVESEPGVGSLFTFLIPLNIVATLPSNLAPAPAEPIDRLLEAHAQNRLGREITRSGTASLRSKDGTNPLPALPDASMPPPSNSGAPLVLVVEDDDRAAEILTLYLSEGGYRVERASNGPEALEKAHLTRPLPALITLDVLLPGKDGWQVLADLKADEETAAIPVIMISIGNPAPALSGAAFGFISKPVIKAELLAMVSQALHLTPSGRN